MSKIVNTEGVKAGCIYRIALENFVTYKQVELFPGLSLNLIIGPNGTGKSTFVCAIILGLCGKTSVIGRAKKISEYVRSGCDQATIEIELYRNAGERNVIITRNFNLECSSNWSIDHKSVREKQVQELINSLNIQVDNLCQLLPQDRVQDFSKMDSQQLLRSTLSAVGGQESVERLDELIETRNKQRNLGTKLVNNNQLLQEQIRLNERLKVVIDAMKQRKEIEKQIEVCEKKKLWIEYQDLREKVVECTNDKREVMKLVNKHKSKMEPLEKVIEKAKSGIRKLEQEKLNANREALNMKEKIKELLESIQIKDYKIKDLESAFQEKLEHHRNREREICEAKTKLEKLVMDKHRLIEIVGDDSKVKMELAELHKPINKTNVAIETLKRQKLEIQYDLENNVMPQIRLFQNRKRNLQDVSVKKLEVLRQFSEDAYQAVLWYRENKQLFQHAVHEPMVLEINFTDTKYARYLESTIANRDLVAFTFESTTDMNLFLKKVRVEHGLKRVNAICSPPSTAMYHPPCPIDDLSYLGFYTYLVETITAPEAIIRYLCKQYSIHRVPIGNDHTYNNSGKVPPNITFFFTANHRFSVRVSAYSGARASSTAELRPARLLANSLDLDSLAACERQLSTFEKSAQAHREKMNTFDSKLSTLEDGLNELYTRRKKITEGIEKVKTICAQIRIQSKKVQTIENEAAFDIEAERLKCVRLQRECVTKQCTMHGELIDCVKHVQNTLLNSDLWKTKLEFSRNSIVQQESELREVKNDLRNTQATLENIENQLNRSKSLAKEKLIEAKHSCNNKLPQDPEFPYKEEFDKLPADVTSLQEQCYELQTRIDCMDKGDERVIKEYENRERMIGKLKSDVNSSSSVSKQLEDKLKRLSSQWLPPLEVLLRDINTRFGDMFAKLGCAGEVKLDKTGGDEDFDGYGVAVLVRFRDSERLQQLTRHAQSGGERALATALYLMALQRLSAAPFRCVDEINQGMDPVNERKMFQLLVKVTTECDTAQYFLLTPKLLSKLEYNNRITVHTIMNGESIVNYKKWKYDQFVERARSYRI